MICNLTDLNSAIDWLERMNIPKIVSPANVVAQVRGWDIIRDIHFGIANQRERLDVAPWVIDELAKQSP